MWRTFQILGAGLLTLIASPHATAFPQQTVPKSGQAERQRTQEQAPSDRALRGIARDIRHELVMLPYYGVFDNLAFGVDGSTVTLLGSSDTTDAEELSGERCEGYRGRGEGRQ